MKRLKRIVLMLILVIFSFSFFIPVSAESDKDYKSMISEAADYLRSNNCSVSENPYCFLAYYLDESNGIYSVCFSDEPFYVTKPNYGGKSYITSDSSVACRFNCYKDGSKGYSGSVNISPSIINIVYLNHDIMNYNGTEIVYSATDPSFSPDTGSDSDAGGIGDYEYDDKNVESEKGGVITKILDPIFKFINWLFSWLPDISTDIDSNWLAELVRLVRSALWFCPKDVIVTAFITIRSWMGIHLAFAIFQFVVRLFTLRI